MALTDKEKEDLKKLSPDDLINLIDGYKESAEKNETAAQEERTKIIREFFNGATKVNPNDDSGVMTSDDGDKENDLKTDKAFQRLKKMLY